MTIIENKRFVGEPKVEGRDNHAYTPERGARNHKYIRCVFDANGAAEALKLSNHWDMHFEWCTFIGGIEDGVDIVRGGRITFKNCHFIRKSAKQDVTCKGSARDVLFQKCSGLGKLVFGQYTKYDTHAIYPDGRTKKLSLGGFARPPVRAVVIMQCGVPSVQCWHSEEPVGEFRRNLFTPFLALPYFLIRSKFKEKLPPAPSEFVLSPEEL